MEWAESGFVREYRSPGKRCYPYKHLGRGAGLRQSKGRREEQDTGRGRGREREKKERRKGKERKGKERKKKALRWPAVPNELVFFFGSACLFLLFPLCLFLPLRASLNKPVCMDLCPNSSGF